MMRRICVVSLFLAAGCASGTPEAAPPEASLERFILCSDDGTSREERIPTAASLDRSSRVRIRPPLPVQNRSAAA